MFKTFINPIFLTDSYKLSHVRFEVEGTEVIYSNYTNRFIHHFLDLYPEFDGKIVTFGLQYIIKNILIDTWNGGFFNRSKDVVIAEAKRILLPYIGMEDLKHFEALHDLGYLPVAIRALKEGSLVSKGIPTYTIENTDERFSWLPNFLETIMSCEGWKLTTVATVARQFRLLVNEYAMTTSGSLEGTDFIVHDFAFRGHSGWQSSAATGGAFLLSSWGSDNIPAIPFIEEYYAADITKEPISFSVAAGEHSVCTLGINANDPIDRENGELIYIGDVLTNKFPAGIVSYPCDSYDYFRFLTSILPKVKDKVMSREGKFVVRADSGSQVHITCGYKVLDLSRQDTYELFTDIGTNSGKVFLKHPQDPTITFDEEVVKTPDGKFYLIDFDVIGEEITECEVKGTIELLWDLFGGTVNDKGFKVLDSHIGFIYGDGITYKKAKAIYDRLIAKGFATTNVVFGIGSYSLNLVGRDHLGSAIKAVQSQVDGVEIPLFKEPKTDMSKKSAKGWLKVIKTESGDYQLLDQVTKEDHLTGELELVFENSVLINEEKFSDIKQRLWA